MMRSMFSGVSGLRAHQTRMDVIGNNVANVNTVGFKSGRVTFQEIFSQTLRGAGAPDATTGRGGTNPMQVGLGLGISSVDTIMTRGSLQRTDNPTDLSIEGEGYFIVKGGEGDTFRFTRAGNFGVDKLGNLVTGSGMNVYGWQDYGGNQQPDGSYLYDTEKPIEPINLYSDIYNKNKRMIAAKETTLAVMSGNLDSSFTVATTPAVPTATPMPVPTGYAKSFTSPMTVYDALGNEYKVNVEFIKNNTYAAGGSEGIPATADLTNAGFEVPVTTWCWRITGAEGENKIGGMTGNIGYLAFDSNGKILPDSVLAANSPYSTTPDVTINPGASIGASAFTVEMDFNKLTMYNADCSAKPTSIDGYPTGNLVTFNIGSDGILTGIYSNGQQQPLGMVALASFENPAGLQKVGDNLFIPTTNSGDFKKGLKPGSEGVGTLNPGTLEMSNVDLSKEFTDMIVTQRGFQANSRIITTSDEMLQELVNLKR